MAEHDLRAALERIAALPTEVRSYDDLPAAAWHKREEIWQCHNIFEIKRLVDEFAGILRSEVVTIASTVLNR